MEDVPSGAYLVRVSAPGHRDETVTVQVHPGTTVPQEVFLIRARRG